MSCISLCSPRIALSALALVLAAAVPGAAQIYDSGTVITAPGAGFLAADVSQLENVPSLNLNVFGFNANQTAGFSIADDFTVCGAWAITDLEFFVYQTASVGPTITGVYVRIWNKKPSELGAATVWPGGILNPFSGNLWGGGTDTFHGYRTVFAPTLAVNREIYAVKVPVLIPLAGGEYWIEVQFTGSGLSGPWVPPISTLGCGKTGNAIQNNAGTYSDLLNGGIYGVGLPFRVYGAVLGGSTAAASVYGVGALGLNGVGAWVLGDIAVPVRQPILGSCYPLRLENGVSGEIPFAILGTTPCNATLPCPLTLLACPPLIALQMPVFDLNFKSQLCVPIPQGNEFCGVCVVLQAFWLDSSLSCGIGHSDGLQLCLGN